MPDLPPLSSRDHARGPENAPITLVQYGDFECPQSHQVFTMLRALQGKYPSSIRLVFRHFPVRTHPNALAAAEAAEAAASQGSFWAMHDALFAHQFALSPADLIRHAQSVGLDTREVQTALDEEVFRESVLIQKRRAVKAGVRSSLNLFVDGALYEDAAVYDVVAELDEQLSSDVD